MMILRTDRLYKTFAFLKFIAYKLFE